MKPLEGTDIMKGFDTETYKGYARLACVEGSPPWLSGSKTRADPSIFGYLADIRGSLCCWNLRFDLEACLKHLQPDQVKRLLFFESISMPYGTGRDKLEIEFIPWKYARITIKDKGDFTIGSVELYDAAQFYHSKLATAAKKVLGDEKIAYDAGNLNTDIRAWAPSRRADLVKYCQRDADLTGRLMRKFLEAADGIGAAVEKPYSCAYVGQQLIKNRVPGWIAAKGSRLYRRHEKMDAIGRYAYHGGRFECLIKGTLKESYLYDINSAYPLFVQEVPHPNSYRWRRVERPSPKARFALVEATVHVPTCHVGPLPYNPAKLAGDLEARLGEPGTGDYRVIFPSGKWRAWFHKIELDNAIRYHGVKAAIHQAWEACPEVGGFEYPLRPLISDMFAQRKAWKATGDPRDIAAKVATNSIYGKMLQRVTVIDECAGKPGAQEWDGNFFKKHKRKPGAMYDPAMAGFITAATRVELLKACRGREQDVAFFATDGILLEGAPLDIKMGDRLGEWSLKNSGKSFVLGNGIYEVDSERRTRGVRREDTEQEKAADTRPLLDRIEVLTDASKGLHRAPCFRTVDKGPLHLAMAMKSHDYSLKDALIWIERERVVDIRKDEKRVWSWPKSGSLKEWKAELQAGNYRSEVRSVRS